jgi:hypothetical protein
LSDVVAGIAVGYVVARAMWYALVERRETPGAGNRAGAGSGRAAGVPAAV